MSLERRRRQRRNRRLKKYHVDKIRKKTREKIRQGKLLKPNCCEHCKNVYEKSEITAHHYNYNSPRNIIWLCKTCHTIVHGGNFGS